MKQGDKFLSRRSFLKAAAAGLASSALAASKLSKTLAAPPPQAGDPDLFSIKVDYETKEISVGANWIGGAWLVNGIGSVIAGQTILFPDTTTELLITQPDYHYSLAVSFANRPLELAVSAFLDYTIYKNENDPTSYKIFYYNVNLHNKTAEYTFNTHQNGALIGIVEPGNDEGGRISYRSSRGLLMEWYNRGTEQLEVMADFHYPGWVFLPKVYNQFTP